MCLKPVRLARDDAMLSHPTQAHPIASHVCTTLSPSLAHWSVGFDTVTEVRASACVDVWTDLTGSELEFCMSWIQ